MRRADLRAILVLAVGGLFVLGATGRLAAQPVVTAPTNVAVPAATGGTDEPGTRSDSAPVEVRVAPLADTVVPRNYGGKKWLAIGPWISDGSSGTAYAGCSMQVVERALNTGDGLGHVVLSGETSCGSGGASYAYDSGDHWSFLKFDTSAAAHVSSARLRLYGARSSKSDVDLWADVFSASGTSWNEKRLNWRRRTGGLLDSVKLAKDKTKRWYEWDVSEWVLQERAEGRNVVTLVLGGNDLASFHSREAKTNKPELVLVP